MRLWARSELLGVDAKSEVFSPRTMEHVHVFKDKDGDDHDAEDDRAGIPRAFCHRARGLGRVARSVDSSIQCRDRIQRTDISAGLQEGASG